MAALAGCGGDDEPAETTRELPELSVTDARRRPRPSEQTDHADDGRSGHGDAPAGGAAPSDTAPADTPESDTAPPEDSPAERFEEYCNENPGACG